MSEPTSPAEFLVISRGLWDKDAAPEDIQKAIDEFYTWLARMVDEGKMKTGQRLGTGGKTAFKNGVVADGPYGETKEVIGGYWFILADSLEEAVKLAGQNPCINYGLFYEIRPIDPVRATAYTVTNETPKERREEIQRRER